MRRKYDCDKIRLGVCYYPEHWDKGMWQDDLQRMKACGIEVIRIAEFAWNKFEHEEGVFRFDFFDEFMELTQKEEISVIFCTPTATPPMWLCNQYPEVLNADIDGNLIHPGMRRHYNLNSPKYRFFAQRIAEKIAEHYAGYDNIVAWQIDNEINCENDLYYSESDHQAFREFLKKRYQTLDSLNKEIGAEFWNQTYTDWDEVSLPKRTNLWNRTNPHIALLQKRFIAESVFEFFKLQANAIRKYSRLPITTNGIFKHIDYHTLTEKVFSYITYDNYPNFSYAINRGSDQGNALMDRNSSYNLSLVRSVSPIFGIMEQQSGPAGWNFTHIQSAPKPGQIRLWTMQAIAHGADFISYFRWRTCPFGTEMYWHGINDYSNLPNRRIEEIKQVYRDLQKIQPVCGKEYYAKAGILQDYDNSWDAEEDLWHSKVRDISHDGWFRAFQKRHIPFDFVNINDNTELCDLGKYELLVYPHSAILTKKRAELLESYVKNGGMLIMGCRTGYKKENGACLTIPMPGYAKDLLGIIVEEYTFLSGFDEEQFADFDGEKVSAVCFNDIIKLNGATEIAIYETNYYKGKTAATVNCFGKGKAYYFGAAFSEDSAMMFINLAGIKSPLHLDIPESVELAIRGEYAFLLNYGKEEVEIPCRNLKDEITGAEYVDKIPINGYDLAVIKVGKDIAV